jgi:hypothetical protein
MSGSTVTAFALAVASRLMFIVADLVTAGAAALLARWRVPAEPEAAQAPTPEPA